MNEHTFDAFYDAVLTRRTVRNLLTRIKADSLLADRAIEESLLRALARDAYMHGWSDAVAVAVANAVEKRP